MSELDEKVDRLIEVLGTLGAGEEGVRAAVAALPALLESPYALAYGIEPDGAGGLRLSFYHWVGDGEAEGGRERMERAVRENEAWGHFDALAPEPAQRNVALEMSIPPVFADAAAQLEVAHVARVLVCDGPVLLASVAALRATPFTPEDLARLGRIIPALQERLLLERQLASGAPASAERLGAALEAIGNPAALVGPDDEVVLANTAFKALLPFAPAELEVVRAHVPGAKGMWRSTRITSPGLEAHWLVVNRQPPDPARRLGGFAARFGLTARQRDVLAPLVSGASNKTIAALLRCAESTVELHVTALLSRTGCTSRSELVARFWTEPGPPG